MPPCSDPSVCAYCVCDCLSFELVRRENFLFIFASLLLCVLFFLFLATQHINILLHFYCHPFSDSPFLHSSLLCSFIMRIVRISSCTFRQGERARETHTHIYRGRIHISMCDVSLPHIKINLAQNNMDFWFIQFCHFTSFHTMLSASVLSYMDPLCPKCSHSFTL